jgi:hypothetical protein
MAVYVWFIELAVVYPPGALTVISQPFASLINANMSVINQPISRVYDTFAVRDRDVSPHLARIGAGGEIRPSIANAELDLEYL